MFVQGLVDYFSFWKSVYDPAKMLFTIDPTKLGIHFSGYYVSKKEIYKNEREKITKRFIIFYPSIEPQLFDTFEVFL